MKKGINILQSYLANFSLIPPLLSFISFSVPAPGCRGKTFQANTRSGLYEDLTVLTLPVSSSLPVCIGVGVCVWLGEAEVLDRIQCRCRVWHYSSHAPCSVSCAPCHVVMLSGLGNPGREMGMRTQGYKDTMLWGCKDSKSRRTWPGRISIC